MRYDCYAPVGSEERDNASRFETCWLDGVQQIDVFMADTEQGVIRRLDRDVNGRRYVDRMTGQPGTIVLRGVVVVRERNGRVVGGEAPPAPAAKPRATRIYAFD